MNIGRIETFPNVEASKAQAVKVLEEAAEVFGAWQMLERYDPPEEDRITNVLTKRLVDECADVIQAVCNLVAAMGVEDMSPYLEACEKRNKKRGRL